MNTFTVTWHPEAEDELARVWITSSDRKRITLAVATVERELANDPQIRGVAIREGLWSLNAAPLRVLFAVSNADSVVEVLMVSVITGKEAG
jgi:mRNA-degrading endonuclease RelE of RelBE toxin-antitoxin system